MRKLLQRLLGRRPPVSSSDQGPVRPAITELDLLRALGCDE
ncbi:hypothetical protein [Deinococcus sp. NW-56]|nr:hypothetical protein [Deinococcus sp. NW-56]